MAAMLMSRLHKRVVAVIAGLAFFLCQSAALAQACSMVAPHPEQIAAQQPCHGSVEQPGSNPQSSGQSGCYYASSAVADLPVFSAADLSAIFVRVEPPAIAVPASFFNLTLLRVEPPPHSILHCCLRN